MLFSGPRPFSVSLSVQSLKCQTNVAEQFMSVILWEQYRYALFACKFPDRLNSVG